MPHAAPALLPPVLAGRTEELAQIDDLIAERPGAIALIGPRGSGRSRLAREVATRLGGDGVRIVVADDGEGEAPHRLAAALTALGLPADPRAAGGRGPFVALMGETDGDDGGAAAVALSLATTRSLAVFWGDSGPNDLPQVPLRPLDDDSARRLVRGAAPGLSPALEERVIELAGGQPGRLVDLARVAEGGDEFAPLCPQSHRAGSTRALDGLDAQLQAILGWAIHLAPDFTTAELAHCTGRQATAVDDDLDRLSLGGVLSASGGRAPTWSFKDPLLAEALLVEIGPARLRRESATALRAGLACGRDAEALVRRAARSGDAEAVCRLSSIASNDAREAGRAPRALQHAERALMWHDTSVAERLRLDGLAARGRARSELAEWEAASADLGEAAMGYAAAALTEERLVAASDSASADWMLGRRDAAFARLSSSLSEDAEPDTPSPGRAESLAVAAGMAVATGRFIDAGDLAGRARRVARACGEDTVATRSLIFATTAEISTRGQGASLADFERAAEEARGEGGDRNATLAAIHHSHALRLLAQPARAVEVARAGVDLAADVGLSDHRFVLLGNLGEALTEAGLLEEANLALTEAAEGWRELGREAPTPADPGRAWLLQCTGHVTDALREYRAIAASIGHDPLFEQVAPATAGHALAAAILGETAEADRVINQCLVAWARTDDRLMIVPVLVAGANMGGQEVSRRCSEALNNLAMAGVEPAALFPASDPAEPPELRRGAVRLEERGLAWWANRLRFMAGSLGEDADAIEDLHLARREFRQMGADGWRLRSEAALRARGQRIPSRAEGRPSEPNALSAREMEVLAKLSLGLRNREIGDELFIAERTVARHVGKILAKLEVPTRTAAVQAAREKGLLPGGVA